MNNKFFTLLIFLPLFLLGFMNVGWGQTNIFNVTGGGTLPTGWAATNNVTTNAIDQTSYYLLDAGNPSDLILTTSYDLSLYSTLTLNVNVATYGSGTAYPMKIEVSMDGGTSWSTTTYTTATPSSSTYIAGGPITITQTPTTTMKFRFSNYGTSGRGVRVQNLNLTASSSNSPSITTNPVSSINITTATGNGNITSIGSSSISVSGICWNTSANPTTSNSKTTDGPTSTGLFTSTMTSLSVNTKYYVKAYATNSSGTGYGSEVNFYTLANVPIAPTVNGATANSLNVTVNVNGNPATTEFAIQETSGSNYLQSDGTLGSTAVWQTAENWGTKTVTGLNSNSNYTFQVKARNGANTETSFSSKTSGTTLLSAPTSISASNINYNSFTANWNTLSGATSYKLDVITSFAELNEGFESGSVPSGWVSTNSNWTISNSSNDVKNGNYAIICGSNNGTLTTSSVSNPTSLSFYLGRTNNTTAKTLTIEISTTSQSSGFITIATFDHNNVPSSSYDQYNIDLSAYASYSNVYIRFNKSSSTTSPWRLDDVNISTVPTYLTNYQDKTISSGTSDNVTGLTPNTTYYYRVRGVNSNGTSASSNIITVNTLAVSSAPTTQSSNLNFSEITSNGMKINWTKGNGSKRLVFVKEGDASNTVPSNKTTYTANSDWNNGNPRGTQIETSGYFCVYNGTETSVALTNLNPNVQYQAMVFEYNNSDGYETYNTTVATNNISDIVNISSNATLNSGTYKNIIVNGNATLSGNITCNNIFTANSFVDCGNYIVSGSGAFTLSSGATLKTANVSGINGAITVSGTKTFDPSANYEFNGTAAQVTGTSLTTANNVIINNPAGVTLSGATTVNGALTLTSGNLITTQTNLMTLGTGASVTGGSATSFVDGPMVWNVNDTKNYTFPVGKGSRYLPMVIKPSTTDASTFKVTYNNTPYSNTNTFGTGIAVVSLLDYYELSRTSGNAAVQLTMSWDATSGITTNNEQYLRVAHWNGSLWEDLGDCNITGDHLSGTITTNNPVSSFSPFVLASSQSDNPMPVSLKSLTSNVAGRNINLKWVTSEEINNAGFDVERKQATGEYVKVGFVKGSGTVTSAKSYEFTDRNLMSGKYSYRLKQIDNNGNFEYFNLSSDAVVGVPSKFDLSQNYPNPFNPATKINFDLPKDSKISLKLYDMLGREVSTLVNEFRTAGYYTVDFNASSLSSGIYFYRLLAGEFSSVKKMVILK